MDLSDTNKLGRFFFSTRLYQAAFLLGGGLLLTIILSLVQGAVTLSWWELWQALLHQGNPTNQTIIWELRLPRIIAALLVGSALGMSGALLQGMLRNGLASPFLL